jgi:putative Mn2+ efflux pump MntP
MDISTILLIAFGLSMDAFAVSITTGIAMKSLHIKHALTVGAWFGSFQAIMPVLGWLAGIGLRSFISGIDHWIAFGLLGFVGIKMIYESFKFEKEEKNTELKPYILFILAVATSIDALAVGLSFSFLNVAIVKPVMIIGMVTFVLSFIGVLISNKIGHFFEKKIEIIGGVILIGIGIKILLQHVIQKAAL